MQVFFFFYDKSSFYSMGSHVHPRMALLEGYLEQSAAATIHTDKVFLRCEFGCALQNTTCVQISSDSIHIDKVSLWCEF